MEASKDRISREEALKRIRENWTPEVRTETVDITECVGRRIAEDIYAMYDIPAVRAAGMDGVAVVSSAFRDENGEYRVPDVSGWRLGNEFVRADTGDDFDDKYDAVIPVEMIELKDDGGIALNLNPDEQVVKNYHVKPAGSSIRKDSLLLEKNRTIHAEQVALIAMSGRSSVLVYVKPKIIFIPTGSELIPAGTPIKRGENYDSNSHMAKALLEEMGAEVTRLPVINDDKEKLRQALLDSSRSADIVIISGGSAKGSEDFNIILLEELGHMICRKLTCIPGKNTGISLINGTPVVNLSGPPMASFFGVNWCVRFMVYRLAGLEAPPHKTVKATLMEPVMGSYDFEKCFRIKVNRTTEGFEAWPVERKSGLKATLSANGIFTTKIGHIHYEAGSIIDIELR